MYSWKIDHVERQGCGKGTCNRSCALQSVGEVSFAEQPRRGHQTDGRRVGHFFQSTNFTPGVEPNLSRALFGAEPGAKCTANMQSLQIAFNTSTLQTSSFVQDPDFAIGIVMTEKNKQKKLYCTQLHGKQIYKHIIYIMNLFKIEIICNNVKVCRFLNYQLRTNKQIHAYILKKKKK